MIGLRLALVFAGLACAAPAGAFDLEDVRAGRCGPCLFEYVSFHEDAVRKTVAFTSPVPTEKHLRFVETFGFGGGGDALSSVELIELVYLPRGAAQAASREVLDGINAACRGDRKTSEACTLARRRLDFRFMGPGRILVVARGEDTSSFPGPHRTWADLPEKYDGKIDYELLLTSSVELHVEGDVEPIGPGRWRYRDKGHGIIAAATVASWGELSRAYAAHQRQNILASAEAIATIPAAPAGSTVTEAVQQHWVWMRRNLEHRQNREDGGNTPSPLADTLARGWGDCKDFALVLAALLHRDGFDSEPVMVAVNSSYAGPDTRVPVRRLNHMILFLPGLGVYVDPTLAAEQPLATGGHQAFAFAVHPGSGPRAIESGNSGRLSVFQSRAHRGRKEDGRLTFPTSRADALDAYAHRMHTLCTLQEIVSPLALDEPSCHGYIDRARPICEEEAAARLPAEITAEQPHRADLRVYFDCLLGLPTQR